MVEKGENNGQPKQAQHMCFTTMGSGVASWYANMSEKPRPHPAKAKAGG
jgi:hypothetical protein